MRTPLPSQASMPRNEMEALEGTSRLTTARLGRIASHNRHLAEPDLMRPWGDDISACANQRQICSCHLGLDGIHRTRQVSSASSISLYEPSWVLLFAGNRHAHPTWMTVPPNQLQMRWIKTFRPLFVTVVHMRAHE